MSVSVRINLLYKSFGDTVALNDIGIEIDGGELFGFIGPDGAGKTTLFRIITTLLLPDKGTVSVNGLDVVTRYRDIRKITGYMPGRMSLYMDLTVEENLKFYAGIFNTSVEENYDLIKDIYKQLEPFKKRRAGALSGGMKQKLALSCALIHKPQLLVLDEPTTGVDAVSRREFWEILKEMQKSGITIVVSTPYMSEANLCDRVALMQNGSVMTVDTPGNIVQRFPFQLIRVKTSKMYPLLYDLQELEEIRSVYRFGEFIHLTLSEADDSILSKLKSYLSEKGHSEIEVSVTRAGIEDCFLNLMTKPEAV